MDMTQLMRAIERILNAAKAAVLATTDAEGHPHMRWMTPTLLHGRDGVLYAVTSPGFAKVAHLQAGPQVEWMIQAPALDEVINVQGRINVVDNPSLKSEIAEAIGKRLTAFWKANDKGTDFVVLETVIESASLYRPMTGERENLELP